MDRLTDKWTRLHEPKTLYALPPAAVEKIPALRALAEEYAALLEKHESLRDEYEAAIDAPLDERRAIEEAVKAGKKPPAPTPRVALEMQANAILDRVTANAKAIRVVANRQYRAVRENWTAILDVLADEIAAAQAEAEATWSAFRQALTMRDDLVQSREGLLRYVASDRNMPKAWRDGCLCLIADERSRMIAESPVHPDVFGSARQRKDLSLDVLDVLVQAVDAAAYRRNPLAGVDEDPRLAISAKRAADREAIRQAGGIG